MGLGTLLLKLPMSTYNGISWVDALFVSVSAVSVTGLSSVDFPSTFTTFGSIVVMLLIQIGAIGIMTVTVLGILLIGRVGFQDLLTAREELGNIESPRNTSRLVARIAGITLLVELVGAVVLSFGFIQGGLGFGEGIFQGLFHAIMAFGNCGFATIPNGDLAQYAGDPVVNLGLIALIILGGLGFPVLVNLYRYRQMRRFTLHSKLVLLATAVLLLIGVLSVAALEWTNPRTLGGEPLGTRLLESLFQGVTPRTAGFSTVDYSQMREPTLAVQIALMFAGAAPASTGGGIKVTALALAFLMLLSQVRGEDEVSAFGRRVPQPLISKALVLLFLSTTLVGGASIILMVSEAMPLVPAVFEITSAFGTVGLSLNVTPELSPFGKLLVVGIMFLGRVGPVTLILALSARQKPRHYVYPREELAIG